MTGKIDDEEVQEQDHDRRERHAAVDVEDARDEEEQHQREQLRHLVADVADDLLVDRPAELDGRDEGAEVVVDQDHLAGLLRHLAARSHRDADVGLLEGGGVVDGVAGHRDDVAVLLHEPGEAQLVFGRHAAEHVQVRAARP